MKKLYPLAFVVLMISCNGCKSDKPDDEQQPPPAANEPKNIGYSIVNVYPHDTSSFTQGLQWHDGFLYEGTGLKGFSRLMKVNLQNGKAVQKISIDNSLFGEGITILNDKIYQLTWQEHKVLVYDLKTLKKIQEFEWPQDGWGITNNGKELIISTGGNNLYFINPDDFRILNTISVWSNYGPQGELNELEYVDGKVYANIYGQDHIVVINPGNGVVEARIDLSALKNNLTQYENTDVLNGIAYDAAKKSFFITGKKWSSLFEVKLN